MPNCASFRSTPNPRIQPQTLRPPHLLNRYQVPRIRGLHMRRNQVDIFLRITFLPAAPRGMHRLHFVSPPVQPPRPFHLHAHRPPIPAPHHEIKFLIVPPRQRHIEPHRLRLQQKRRLRNLPRPLRIPPQPHPPLLLRINASKDRRNYHRTRVPHFWLLLPEVGILNFTAIA